MAVLTAELQKVLEPGMAIPPEFAQLYEWIEAQDLVLKRGGKRFGHLGDDHPTKVTFEAEGNRDLHYWFGHKRKDVITRLCVFCKTSMDGSMGALWLDPQGRQHVVNLGSGSGSTMVCVLADSALDFLRLLAVGYDEVGFDATLSLEPEHRAASLRSPYTRWLTSTFGTDIPALGTDIVHHPERMYEPKVDPFNQWVAAALQG